MVDKDPVNGMEGKEDITATHNGKTYYFSNEKSRDMFAQSPEQYINKNQRDDEVGEKMQAADQESEQTSAEESNQSSAKKGMGENPEMTDDEETEDRTQAKQERRQGHQKSE
ncbi:MAG: YHS domain-containing protein [Candidatus Aenigmarchaeota archaeon]|nr:YHS domain-containing protein [Candidatus Aenigmarchaeota archaeon]